MEIDKMIFCKVPDENKVNFPHICNYRFYDENDVAIIRDIALGNARNDRDFWELIVEKEIQFTKLPGTLDCGMNIIYVVQKI